MIQPTVGLGVWFYPARSCDQPLAAIIAHVHSDTCVNLAIFDANGRPWPGGKQSVQLVQPGEAATPDVDYCGSARHSTGWRPAAKAETLPAELAAR